MKINITLIMTLIFLIVNGLVLAVANSQKADGLIVTIAEMFVFNLTGTEGAFVVLGYFAVTYALLVTFLGLFCGSESVKNFILCTLINTLGLFFIIFIFGGIIYPIMNNVLIIIISIIALPFIIRMLIDMATYSLEIDIQRKDKLYKIKKYTKK